MQAQTWFTRLGYVPAAETHAINNRLRTNADMTSLHQGCAESFSFYLCDRKGRAGGDMVLCASPLPAGGKQAEDGGIGG